MKRLHRIILLFLALCPAGCSDDQKSASPEQRVPVQVENVERADVPRRIEAIGNMQPSASVEVRPRVTGEIHKIFFKEGQEVTAQQPLIGIDTRPYEAAVKERRAELAKSRAQLVKAREDRQRYGQLADKGYVSREAYDQAATDASVLAATVKANEAALESSLLDLSYCTVRSPISGRAGRLNLDQGNMIRAGDDKPIVTIDTISPIYVNFSVPEVYLQTIMKKMDSGEAAIIIRPTGGEMDSGKLALLDNAVDTRTGTIRLRGILNNDSRRLWPGQFVHIYISLGTEKDALTVPRRAVQKGRDKDFVYVVDSQGNALAKNIDVLFEAGDRSVVLGDLTPGEQVVVEGQIRLASGVPVHIVKQ